jgi:hypothetical protein
MSPLRLRWSNWLNGFKVMRFGFLGRMVKWWDRNPSFRNCAKLGPMEQTCCCSMCRSQPLHFRSPPASLSTASSRPRRPRPISIGPLFVFGQFGASSPSVDEQQPPRWQGKYGVGVKLKPGIVDELQVRGGPTVRSDDTGRLARGPAGEPSELFLEAVTKVGLPVLGPLNVEYLNTATPSPTHHERSLFNQEFRLARPLTGGGQVHLGARYRPDDSSVADSWVEHMQVFMGFELKRQPIRQR